MKLKKLAFAGLAAATVLSLTACNGGDATTTATKGTGTAGGDTTTQKPAEKFANEKWIDDADDETVYDNVWGKYEEYAHNALEATNVNERYYWFAKAEAWALDQALYLPTESRGGNYAINRTVPGCGRYAQWGYDDYRYDTVVTTTEFIKKEDVATLRAKRDAAREANAAYKVYSDGTHTTTYNPKAEVEALGYTTKDTYTFADSAFNQTYDVTDTYRAADYTYIVNYYAGLINYDNSGAIVPGVAQSWSRTENADGTETWTFNLRHGVKYVNSAKEEKGEVTAQDFVYGMKRTFTNGKTSYMLAPIKGYDEAVNKEDASKLAIEATDNYTLKITLAEKNDFFLTYLTYAPFNAVKESYVTEKGDTYGTTKNDILYTGPYVCTAHDDESNVTMEANTAYWDYANVTAKTVTVIFDAGDNPQATYNRGVAGTTEGSGLNSVTLELAKADGNFAKYAYVTENDSNSYYANFNLNRLAYSTEGYDSVTSGKTDEQKANTRYALVNTNFRKALFAGVNRHNWEAAQVGADLADVPLRNLYVPYDFVSLTEETEGYAAGSNFGDIVLGEMKKMGSYVTDLHDGQDAYYNAAKAKEYVEAAWAEMGLDDTDKIYVDWLVYGASPTAVAAAEMVAESVDKATDGKIVLNLVKADSVAAYYYAGYYADTAEEVNFDFTCVAGWGPDYGDPLTYIATLLPNGDMMQLSGINAHDSTKY